MRKAVKAARTESDLETHRLTGPLADELAEAQSRAAAVRSKAHLTPAPAPEPAPESEPEPEPDVRDARPAHLRLITSLLGGKLLWARSTPTHAVWCERRHAAAPGGDTASRDVLRVIEIENGQIVARWSFG